MAGPANIPRWAAQMDGHRSGVPEGPGEQNPAYRPAHRHLGLSPAVFHADESNVGRLDEAVLVKVPLEVSAVRAEAEFPYPAAVSERVLPPVATAISFIDCINRRDVAALGQLMTEDHILQVFDEPPLVGRQRNIDAWHGYAANFPTYVIYPHR